MHAANTARIQEKTLPALHAGHCSVPKRRFGISITAGGDTLEDISEFLEHIAREMTVNPGIMGSTVGGCSYGGHYDIEDRGEHITAAAFKQQLRDWIASKRAAQNVSNQTPPPMA